MAARVFGVLVLVLCCTGLYASPFSIEPQNTNAALGETVALFCKLNKTRRLDCNVFWYRSDEQMYISRNRRIIDHLSNDIKERYSILGNRSNSDFSLQIRNVVEADAGDYKCACFPRSHSSSYLSPPAAIYIVVRPPEEYPICKIRDRTPDLIVGERTSFMCETAGAKPSVALQWMRGTKNVVADLTFNPHSISVYHKQIVPEDSGIILTCVASGLALKVPRNCTIGPLSVISPLRIQAQKVFAKHGTRQDPRVIFTCNSEVNQTGLPSMYNYTWYANNARITSGTKGFILGTDGNSIQVTDLSLFSQNIHIACEARGRQGSLGNVSTLLDMDSFEGYATIPVNELPRTEPPIKGIVSVSGNKHFDVRPFVFLGLGAFVLMTTMIGIIILIPRRCCHTKSSSALRRRDSKFTTMQYVQRPTGSPARAIAHQESLNLYESTADSDTESGRHENNSSSNPMTGQSLNNQQNQQVQATLHVVVHSGNDPTNPHLATRKTSTGTIDDQSSIYQELPPPPPPPLPPTSNTLQYHPPMSMTGSAPRTIRNQTWGHSSYKDNPYGYADIRPDLMHYDHLGGCYVQTLPIRPAKPTVHQAFLYTPQYAEIKKVRHKPGAGDSQYENIPMHHRHGHTRTMSVTGY